MATDLTFTQLAAALPANSIVVSDGSTPLTAGVYINASNVTGDAIDALGDMGVVETMAKLLKAGRTAQETINANAAQGESLNAFSTPANSAPTIDENGNFNFQSSRSVTVEVTANLDTAAGPQV